MKLARAAVVLAVALMAGRLWAITTGTISTAGGDCSLSTTCVIASLGPGTGGVVVTVTGSFTGTLQFESTGDGVNYVATNVTPLNSTTAVTSTTGVGTWQVNAAGLTNFRVRGSSFSGGTATVSLSTSTASARTNSGSGSGTGACGQPTCANTALSNLTTTAVNQSLNFSTGTHAGSADINLGSPANSGQNLLDWVDQGTGNIYRTSMSGSSYNGVWDPVIISGWNAAQGGGVISNSFGAIWNQIEGDYNLSGAGTDTMEYHNIIQGTNGAYTRWQTCQFAVSTGTEKFCNYYLDTGMGWYYGAAGDGTPITATAAWSSPNGGTFTYTIGTGTWPWDYIATSTSVFVTSCSTSAYNIAQSGAKLIASGGTGTTTFTVTGVGANPGSSATGCSVQGGVNSLYAQVNGRSSSNGLIIEGNLPATIGGAIVENNSGNSLAGLQLTAENTKGGASNNTVFHADGVSLAIGSTAIAAGSWYFPGTTGNEYLFSDGTNLRAPGQYYLNNNIGLAVGSGLPLAISSVFRGSISGGLAIANNYTADNNFSGQVITTNGGGATLYNVAYQTGSGGPTPITAVYNCGWSSVACNLVGGSTVGVAINTSGNVNLASGGGTLSYNGTAGVTAGSFSAVTAIQTKLGGVTVLTGTSDARLKNIVAPFSRGLEAIMQLSPQLYRWNDKGQKITGFPADLTQAGFIAQNVQQAIPEAVGHEEHDGTEYLTLADRPIIAALVNAVKEQQAEIEQLKAEISTLRESAHVQ